MTFEDVRQTLGAAQSGGRIGTPVSLRLHLRITDCRTDLRERLGTCLELAESIFEQSVSRLMAQSNGNERHISVIANYAGGQTATVTATEGSGTRAELHLLLVGNRGIVRMQGGEDFDETSLPMPSQPQRWKSLIEESLRQRTPVDAAE